MGLETNIPKVIRNLKASRSATAYPCIFCGGATGVTDSRSTGNGRRRRRFCMECHRRFSTFEVVMDGTVPPPKIKDQLVAVAAKMSLACAALQEIAAFIASVEGEQVAWRKLERDKREKAKENV